MMTELNKQERKNLGDILRRYVKENVSPQAKQNELLELVGEYEDGYIKIGPEQVGTRERDEVRYLIEEALANG